MATCRGTTRGNLPCQIYFGLDSNGYCSHHKPRQMCVITSCQSKAPFDHRGRCIFAHKNYALLGDPRCTGTTKDGRLCRLEPRPDSTYCSPQHDPANELLDPAEFRVDGLRLDREDLIARRDYSKDIYSSDSVVVRDRKNVELDHILEIQVINATFAAAAKKSDDATRHWLANVLKRIVNENDNLGLTTKTINAFKGKAVKEFLDQEPLASQRPLRIVLRTCLSERLVTPRTVRMMFRRIQDAYEFVKTELQDELPKVKREQKKEELLGRFIDMLDRMAEAMGLTVAKPAKKDATLSESASLQRKKTAIVTPPSSPPRTSIREPTIAPSTKTNAQARRTLSKESV